MEGSLHLILLWPQHKRPANCKNNCRLWSRQFAGSCGPTYHGVWPWVLPSEERGDLSFQCNDDHMCLQQCNNPDETWRTRPRLDEVHQQGEERKQNRAHECTNVQRGTNWKKTKQRSDMGHWTRDLCLVTGNALYIPFFCDLNTTLQRHIGTANSITLHLDID